MMKKIIIAVAVLAVLAAALVGTGVALTKGAQAEFSQDGYVLTSNGEGIEKIAFLSGEKYSSRKSGSVSFNSDGKSATVDAASFAIGANGGVSGLTDGVLLDFNDMSDNYINNYYISSGLTINGNGEEYTAESTAGTITFGENLWKLSDGDYMIRSSELKVHFSDADERMVEEFVVVSIGEDGIVHILTSENKWSTISEDCFIETAKGVRIYPLKGIIDNGTYKMGVAEMSVNPDDSIVLSEDETRRQIVPELNFTTIDGENGTDGTIGQDGTEGKDGVSGSEGNSGTVGDQGETGGEGQEGKEGQLGEEGETPNEMGQTGDTGTPGAGGGGGTAGADGDPGTDVTTQSTAYSEMPAMTLGDLTINATTAKGKIIVQSGVTNLSELLQSPPDDKDYSGRVTIYNEKTGEKIVCYRTTETWTDNNGKEFDNWNDDGIYFRTEGNPLQPDTAYRLSVVAYYTANSNVYSREFISRTFYTDSTGVYLTNKDATTSTISIDASVSEAYKNNVQVAYVCLLKPSENENFILPSNDTELKQYLDNYTHAKITYKNGEIDSIDYRNADGTDSTSGEMPLVFTGLTSDTNYIARAIVMTRQDTSTITVLANQELEARTLKTPPVYNTADKPSAGYNRVSGAFEVYRPIVADKQNGVENYTYQALDVNGNVVQEKTILPQLSDPVSFYLTSGEYYAFRVLANFNDNEKTVVYDLGTSSSIASFGDTMPKLVLTTTSSEYNSMTGQLTIRLGANTAMAIDKNRPLVLTLTAEGVTGEGDVIVLYNTGAEGQEWAGEGKRATAVGDEPEARYKINSNDITVDLNLHNLYKNTNYTITVNGFLDMNGKEIDPATGEKVNKTGLELQDYTIGNVSFRTKNPITLTAVWSTISNGENGYDEYDLNRILRMSAVTDAEQDQSRLDYAIKADTEPYGTLLSGRIELDLYRGTGLSKKHQATALIDSTTMVTKTVGNEEKQVSALSELYGSEGLSITAKDTFGNVTLQEDADYTLTISYVVDETYKMDLGYENNFVNVNHNEETVFQTTSLPALINLPHKGITATPITKETAGDYIADPSKLDADWDKLPSDTIVGYRLKSQFNNTQKLGKTITYYAMEYSSFYNAITNMGQDPVGETGDGPATKLMKITMDIMPTSNTAPECIIFFGGNRQVIVQNTKDGNKRISDYNSLKLEENEELYSDVAIKGKTDIPIFYAGDAIQGTDCLTTGMGRGYRYVFAYTAACDLGDGKDTIYPYKRSDFVKYAQLYGAGVEESITIGAGKCYVLNSGMQSAPRQEPEIHSFLYSAIGENDAAGSTTSGTAVIYYKYKNHDGTIITDGSAGGNTKITWKNMENPAGEDQSVDMGQNSDKVGDSDWFKVEIPYTVGVGTRKLIAPEIKVAFYALDYTRIIQEIKAGALTEKDTDTYYLCKVPIEGFYKEYFESLNSEGKIKIRQENHFDQNYIDFILEGEGSTAAQKLVYPTKVKQRIFGIKLKFKTTDKGQEHEKIFLVAPGETELGYPKVTVSTTDLRDFVGREYDVTASIYYDNGNQGWCLLDENNSVSVPEEDRKIPVKDWALYDSNGKALMGLQYQNSGDLEDTWGLNSYIVGKGNSSNPSGGLFRQIVYSTDTAVTVDKMMQSLADLESPSKVAIIRQQAYTSGNSTTTGWFYIDHMGVEYGTEESLLALTGHYLVPKYVSESDIAIENPGGGITGDPPPVIGEPNAEINLYSVNVNINTIQLTGFRVENFKNALKQTNDGKYYIHLAAFRFKSAQSDNGTDKENSYKAALAINYDDEHYNYDTIDDPGEHELIIRIDEEGYPITEDGIRIDTDDPEMAKLLLFDNLQTNQGYWIAAWAERKDGTNKVLLQKGTNNDAIYEFCTISTVNIVSGEGFKYFNENYFNRYATLSVNISPYSNCYVNYDLFDEEIQVNSSTGETTSVLTKMTAEPCIDHATLTGDNGILSGANVTLTKGTLDLKMNLEPHERRAKIKPGNSYWLRITVYSKSGDKFAGVAVYKLTITPFGNYGAYIVAKKADPTSVTFQVTLNDINTGYPFMSRKINETSNGGALYAVRFTKTVEDNNHPGETKEILVSTDYDDELFSEYVAQKEFILLSSDRINETTKEVTKATVHSTVIGPNEKYKIYVYAVKDLDQVGSNALYEGADTDIVKKYKGNHETLFLDHVVTAEGEDGYMGGELNHPFTEIIDSFWYKVKNEAENLGVGDNIASLDRVEETFIVASREQMTTDDDGILVNDAQSTVKRANSTQIQLVLRESFGLLDEKGNQVFKKIVWSVSGYSSKQDIISDYGTLLASKGNEMFKYGEDNAGYGFYYLFIPTTVPPDSPITLTVQLFRDENASKADFTISKSFES